MERLTDYSLINVATERRFEDQGWLLADPQHDRPSLIRTVYGKKRIEVKDEGLGLYRFMDWLPVRRILEGSSAPVTYRSEGLASYLGLRNLYITFSGYWPERKAYMKSCSFKETEAYSVCGRLDPDSGKILVVSSAGNTARAFAKVCSENGIPLLITIPEANMDSMWFEEPLAPCVRIVATPEGTDYFDAIQLGNIICRSDRFVEEGGARNVARRDGMGTTVLSAAMEIGRIPDAYFQAVGSGTGTIAAWEANLRLLEDGRFGNNRMKLYPAQNIPFTPMADSWEKGIRDIVFECEEKARRTALEIDAKVLSNRKPPYGIPGGLFDAMKDNGGRFFTATNGELAEACELFERTEGIDVNKAAGVATAALKKAIAAGEVTADTTVMLNITGGGEKRFMKDRKLFRAEPDAVIDPTKMSAEEISESVEELYR